MYVRDIYEMVILRWSMAMGKCKNRILRMGCSSWIAQDLIAGLKVSAVTYRVTEAKSGQDSFDNLRIIAKRTVRDAGHAGVRFKIERMDFGLAYVTFGNRQVRTKKSMQGITMKPISHEMKTPAIPGANTPHLQHEGKQQQHTPKTPNNPPHQTPIYPNQ